MTGRSRPKYSQAQNFSCSRCKSRRSASVCRCSSSRSSGWGGSSLLDMDAGVSGPSSGSFSCAASACKRPVFARPLVRFLVGCLGRCPRRCLRISCVAIASRCGSSQYTLSKDGFGTAKSPPAISRAGLSVIFHVELGQGLLTSLHGARSLKIEGGSGLALLISSLLPIGITCKLGRAYYFYWPLPSRTGILMCPPMRQRLCKKEWLQRTASCAGSAFGIW